MARRDIQLWLHEGTLAGAKTAFEGEVFYSVLPAKGVGREALAELGHREAVLVLMGPDALPGRMVAAVASGVVDEIVAQYLPEAGRTPFTSVTVLGCANAQQHEATVRYLVSLLPNVAFLDGLATDPVQSSLPQAWIDLATVFGDVPAWLTVRSQDSADAYGAAHPGLTLYCHGRGADAKAELLRAGIKILAGSRCSPMDATPSLIAPVREAIKRLVDDGSLVKIDGVWQFARDVSLRSHIQAASIVMRTYANASYWETDEGDTLVDRLNARNAKR